MNTHAVLTILLIVLALSPVRNASAVSLVPTDGFIMMSRSTPVPFDDVFVQINGGNFSLTNSFLQDSFQFSAAHNPALFLLAPGDSADFSGRVLLGAPSDLLVFNGISYRASGQLGVSAVPMPVATSIVEPFTLNGTIHGVSLTGTQSIDFDLTASGMLSAGFDRPGPGEFELSSVRYNINTVPEPGSALLAGTGLVALRWLKRRGKETS